MSEKTKSNKSTDFVPVFRLKPMGTNRAISKYIGTISSSEQLTDQPIEIDEFGLNSKRLINKFAYHVGTFGQYELISKACVCNISGSYLIKNNKLPVYYATLLYDKRFVSGQLFTIFAYFSLDERTESELLAPKQYVNKMMTGKFTIELVSDESFLGYLIEKRKPAIETELMTKYMDQFDEADDNGKTELMKKISDETAEKLNGYRKLFEPIELAFPKKKDIVNKINEIYCSESFIELISIGLDQREQERKEKSCPDQEYKIPKKVINLKEIKENPEKLDEIMNNLSDIDSDDE